MIEIIDLKSILKTNTISDAKIGSSINMTESVAATLRMGTRSMALAYLHGMRRFLTFQILHGNIQKGYYLNLLKTWRLEYLFRLKMEKQH